MRLITVDPVGFEANSYLLAEGGDALLIDAGAPTATVKELLAHEDLTLHGILLTHAHFDHTISAEALLVACSCPLYLHPGDRDMLGDPDKNGLSHFFGRGAPTDFAAFDIRPLGDELPFAGHTLRALHTPGHSRGSVCLLCGDMLLTGDTLFAHGFGRYDLYGGDAAVLRDSLASLRTLSPTLTIYPGHGESTSLGAALSELAFFIS